MDKILNKLGVYDIIGVLFTGICVTVIATFLETKVYESGIIEKFDLHHYGVTFLVVSYMIGLLLQELGSFLYNEIFYGEDELLVSVFTENNNKRRSLTKEECARLGNIMNLQTKSSEENESDYINTYFACKYWIAQNMVVEKVDKNQALAAMSRSMVIFFALESIRVMLVHPLSIEQDCTWVMLFLLFLFIVFLFHRRYIRFSQMRYVTIFREYLALQAEKDDLEKGEIVIYIKSSFLNN